MLRVLLVIIVLALLVWLARRALAPRAPGGERGESKAGVLVTCANCGLLLPEAEALDDGGRYFCCKSHALSGPRTE